MGSPNSADGRSAAGDPPGQPASRGADGELAAIARLARRLPPAPPDELWIGDDAAVVGGWGRLVVSTDLAVAGVHADLRLATLEDFGWKAVAAAVSDLAAMGVAPSRLVVAVAGPPDTDLDRLYDGITAAGAHHGCAVVGGDLSTAGQLVVAVTVFGGVDAAPEPVRRSGARPGDTVLVTGPLGAAAAGLRLLQAGAARTAAPAAACVEAQRRPVARIAAGIAARLAGASAMIDVSDGLAADVGHLSQASGVQVELSHLPVAPGATRGEALSGGEDYELVIAAPDPEAVVRAVVAAGERAPVVCGACRPGRPGVSLDGRPLAAEGWQHPWR